MNEKIWTEFENFQLNNGITKARIQKLKGMFRAINRGLNKNLRTVTRKDMEKFVTKISKNEFTRENGKPYSGNSKSDIKKFLKQFYKWLKGNAETYPPEVSWIKTTISKDEKPKEKEILSVSEVEKLANSFSNEQLRMITLLLFDSGFRIGEMLSVEKKDLTWEEFETGKKCWWIKCNDSKTEIRKIPIGLFTEEINNFVNGSYFRNISSKDKIFPLSYSHINHSMARHAKKLLNKKVSPHALRHSSATYYSQEYNGDTMLIGQRYGWSYSSKELATYIRRSGAYQRQGAKKTYNNEVVKLKEEVAQLKQREKESYQAVLHVAKKLKELEDIVMKKSRKSKKN